MRNLEFPELLHTPYTPSYACSGIIDELGAESLNFKKGDEVIALIPLDSKIGGCAEFTVQPVLNICQSLSAPASPTSLHPHDRQHERLIPCLESSQFVPDPSPSLFLLD
jgi:NADPH:quinone reductase-like Zn-dependent oxidoreductase